MKCHSVCARERERERRERERERRERERGERRERERERERVMERAKGVREGRVEAEKKQECLHRCQKDEGNIKETRDPGKGAFGKD